MQILLKLKNGGKEELTMDEARELYNELHQIFAKPAPVAPVVDWPHARNPWGLIGVPKGPSDWPLPQTWCGNKLEYAMPVTTIGAGSGD